MNDTSEEGKYYKIVGYQEKYGDLPKEKDIYIDTLEEMLRDFAREVQQLHALGQNDIILDPGFGFGKTLEQNFAIVHSLEKLRVMGLPLLVGLSRKSMIWKRLQTTADEALNGTTVLNTLALLKGASILRVHDVRQAVEAVRLCSPFDENESTNQ